VADLTDLKNQEAALEAQLQAARDKIAAATAAAAAAAAAAETASEPAAAADPAGIEEGGGEEEGGEEDHEGDVDKKIADWKAMGNAHFASQEFDEAIAQYSRCLKAAKKLDREDDKAFTAIYANRSAAHLATKKWVKASWDAQCAAKCDPLFWKAHWRHGVSLMAMAPRIERSTNAVKAFEACLPLAPEEKKGEVTEALERARIRLQEGKDRTPMPPQCAQS